MVGRRHDPKELEFDDEKNDIHVDPFEDVDELDCILAEEKQRSIEPA